jgi:hypothetical protein
MTEMLGWATLSLIAITLAHNLTIPEAQNKTSRRNLPLIAAVVSINLMSALDALSTLFLVDNNHSKEMNPVMNALIQTDYLLFIAVKLGITLTATLVCVYYYESKKRARTILKLASRAYCLLMAYHMVLLASVLI